MKKELTDLGIRQAMKLLRANPEKALPKLMSIVDVASHGEMPVQRAAFRRAIEDEGANTHRMLMRVLNEVDPDILDTLIVNFALNANMEGWRRQVALREECGCNIPWAILLDPTSACNLHCKGCWAADYGKRLNLSFDDIDSIIEQGKQLGVYFYRRRKVDGGSTTPASGSFPSRFPPRIALPRTSRRCSPGVAAGNRYRWILPSCRPPWATAP